jgi:hypothetical protein
VPGNHYDIFQRFRQNSPIYSFGVSPANISCVRYDSGKLELREVSSALTMEKEEDKQRMKAVMLYILLALEAAAALFIFYLHYTGQF